MQKYNEMDPPCMVRRASGKRLFHALEESSGKRAKRIKNNGTDGTQNIMQSMCQVRRLLALLVILVVTAMIVGKFAIQW